MLHGLAAIDGYNIRPTQADWHDFLNQSTLAEKICRHNTVTRQQLADALRLNEVEGYVEPDHAIVSNAYTAALITDFVRQMILQTGQSFTFETVMSSSDKIDTIRRAKAVCYFVRLFYVTTRDPEINVSRVANRMQKGGHFVPVDKIHDRYWRSLDNLADALRLADEAYLYDNSTDGRQSLEIAWLQDGILTVKADLVPDWYSRYVEQKLL